MPPWRYWSSTGGFDAIARRQAVERQNRTIWWSRRPRPIAATEKLAIRVLGSRSRKFITKWRGLRSKSRVFVARSSFRLSRPPACNASWRSRSRDAGRLALESLPGSDLRGTAELIDRCDGAGGTTDWSSLPQLLAAHTGSPCLRFLRRAPAARFDHVMKMSVCESCRRDESSAQHLDT